MPDQKAAGQFELLGQRRFLPFFITQFLGALNDNVFKNALIIMIVFRGAELVEAEAGILINVAAGLFILPFFLFSATAGQWIDKYEKSRSIRNIKLLEVVIMLLAAWAFHQGHVYFLIALLFMMGAQSTFFGPAKYSYIPQHLKVTELIEGNALVQSGTFVAILLGTILGGVLIAQQQGHVYVSIAIVVIAVAGYLASRFIPQTPSLTPALDINWNIFSETWRNMRFLKSNRVVFLSILGISWFWFLGATYLVQLPNYTKTALGGNEEVVTLLLTLFTIGIGAGSLLCNKLSGDKVEIGLVPFGSLGLTLFGIDLYFTRPETMPEAAMGLAAFIDAGHWRLMIDILMLGMFGGFYIVPLMALVQERSNRKHMSRVIAGNNIINALLMVLSAAAAIAAHAAGLDVAGLFLLVALINALVAVYIYTLVPEFFLRFVVWIMLHTIYRVRYHGLENIPDKGPVVLVCNHVSYVDAMIIGGLIRRPVRFVIYFKIYRIPGLHFIFRIAKTIPIAGKFEDKALLEKAFDDIDDMLRKGEVVCMFPEGKLTFNGRMNTFRDGIERVIERRPVPVIPMALQGLWGSAFSRHKAPLPVRLYKGFRSQVALVVGKPIPPQEATAARLQQEVKALFEARVVPRKRFARFRP